MQPQKIKAATVLTPVAATTLREKGGRETFSLRQLNKLFQIALADANG